MINGVPPARLGIDPGNRFRNEPVMDVVGQTPELGEQPVLDTTQRLAIGNFRRPSQIGHVDRLDRASLGRHEAGKFAVYMRVQPEVTPAEAKFIGTAGEKPPDGIAEGAPLVDLDDAGQRPGDANELLASPLPVLDVLQQFLYDNSVEACVCRRQPAHVTHDIARVPAWPDLGLCQ